MRFSAEPAALIRPETSDDNVELESNDPFCECDAVRETEDMAESIEEVRGAWPGRRGEPINGGEAVERGDGGDEWPSDKTSGRGDEMLRS